MATLESAVEQHYSGQSLAERILEAARSAGVTQLTPGVLAPADEFHSGGIQATRDLIALAELKAGERLLDVGCGIGGPARVIATEAGCHVTGRTGTRRSGRRTRSTCRSTTARSTWSGRSTW